MADTTSAILKSTDTSLLRSGDFSLPANHHNEINRITSSPIHESEWQEEVRRGMDTYRSNCSPRKHKAEEFTGENKRVSLDYRLDNSRAERSRRRRKPKNRQWSSGRDKLPSSSSGCSIGDQDILDAAAFEGRGSSQPAKKYLSTSNPSFDLGNSGVASAVTLSSIKRQSALSSAQTADNIRFRSPIFDGKAAEKFTTRRNNGRKKSRHKNGKNEWPVFLRVYDISRGRSVVILGCI